MAFTQRTITHHFENADGTAASGSITMRLSGRMTNGTVTIVPAEVTANLDATGDLSQVLTSNVDAATSPQTTTWQVDFRILGASEETFAITVPVGPGTTDLGSLLPQQAYGG